ncbi:hypothetical protein [Anaerosinus massiliensis]|uniref:hypothetical protein n=1 Tax=Massilibacillus massiliensis TaxID=1806837 RepID=UPI000DA61A4F|nr:hypothetical protein [Massilibacillus massiliensis]
MKKFLVLLLFCIGILVAAFFFFFPSENGTGKIDIISRGKMNQSLIENTQKTTVLFKQFLKAEMKLELTRDIKLLLCSTQEEYTNVLAQEIHLPKDKAMRQGKLSAGISNDKLHMVALNGAANKMQIPQNLIASAGHELFHQVQAQLSHNNDDKGLYWLKEGTADYIGAALTEKSGFQSLAVWQLDTINILRNADSYVSVSEISHIDLDSWTTLMEQEKYPYQVSDLMVCYLLSKQDPDKNFTSIADYFRLLNDVDDEKAFEQAFGIPLDQFLKEFRTWFHNIMAAPATIEVIASADVAPETINDVERSTKLTRQFFQNNWHSDLRTSQRLLLTNSKDEYLRLLKKEFGMHTETNGKDLQDSIWFLNTSSTLIDTSALPDRHQKIFMTSTIMTKRFQTQLVSPDVLVTMSWLVNGSASVVAAHIVETAGLYTMEDYKYSWLNSLHKKTTLPYLSDLRSEQDWISATDKYGADTVYTLSELAALHLVEQYGFASLHTWLETVKSTGNTEEAFTKVYGISSSQYDLEFKDFLRKQAR